MKTLIYLLFLAFTLSASAQLKGFDDWFGVKKNLGGDPPPAGKQLYTTDNGNLYTVNTSDASKTLVGNNGLSMRSLTYWSPNGKFISSGGVGAFSIFVDPSTGAVINPTSNWSNPIADATKASDGNVYYAENGGFNLYRLDNADTGARAFIGSLPDSGGPGASIVTMNNGQSYYVGGSATTTGGIYPIDCATGAIGVGVPLTGDISNGIRSMANYNGTIYAVDITGGMGAGRLITIDPTTAVCTLVGVDGNPGTWYNLATAPLPTGEICYTFSGFGQPGVDGEYRSLGVDAQARAGGRDAYLGDGASTGSDKYYLFYDSNDNGGAWHIGYDFSLGGNSTGTAYYDSNSYDGITPDPAFISWVAFAGALPIGSYTEGDCSILLRGGEQKCFSSGGVTYTEHGVHNGAPFYVATAIAGSPISPGAVNQYLIFYTGGGWMLYDALDDSAFGFEFYDDNNVFNCQGSCPAATTITAPTGACWIDATFFPPCATLSDGPCP